MKAGIITMYGNVNYGNKLQNYAVAKLLSMRGIRSETLIPRSQPCVVNHAWRFVRRIQEKSLKGVDRERFERFASFTRETLPRYLLSTKAKRWAAREYDFLVLGSDQIWNPYAFNLREERFGSFFPAERVICVAPSFGVSDLPSECLDYYQKGLSRLGWISVREDDGAELIRRLTGKKVPVLADPTIGLPVAEWQKVASSKRCPDTPYMLLYFLGGLSREQSGLLQNLASRAGVGIVDMLDKSNARYYCADPGEFIGLLANAECAFTDSFHAAVFAMLFDTPISILKRRGSARNIFSRLETFAATYGLKDRVVENIDPDEWKKYSICNYSESWLTAEKKRRELNEFIDGFIETLS